MWYCSRHIVQKVFCDLLFSHRSCQLNFWRKKIHILGRAGISKSKVESTFLLSTSRFCCGGNREKRGFRFRVIYPQLFYCAYLEFRAKRKKYFRITLLYIFDRSAHQKETPKGLEKTSTLLPFPPLIGYPGNFFFTSLGTAQVLFSASFVWGMCTFRKQSHFLQAFS